jgi:hypothetical protein
MTHARGLDDIAVETRDSRWAWEQLYEVRRPAVARRAPRPPALRRAHRRRAPPARAPSLAPPRAQAHAAKPDGPGLEVLIPETVVFAHGAPIGWLHSGPHGTVQCRPPSECALRDVRSRLSAAAHASMATPADAHRLRDAVEGTLSGGLTSSTTGARTAAAAAALAAADASKLPPPPYAAVARRIVRGGGVVGVLLQPAQLRDALASSAALGSVSTIQAYVQPAAGPGARLRCQLQVGQDGNARLAVFLLNYEPAGAPPPAAARAFDAGEASELTPSSARPSRLRGPLGRTLGARASEATGRLLRALSKAAHVQVRSLRRHLSPVTCRLASGI